MPGEGAAVQTFDLRRKVAQRLRAALDYPPRIFGVDGHVGREPRGEAVDAAAVQGIDEERRIGDGSDDCAVG